MRFLVLTSALALTSLLLTGCGGFQSPSASVPAVLTYTSGIGGSLHGGQQPIKNSTVNLYQTGATGYGTGASMIATTTTTASGSFSIASFSCTPGTQLYLTATGGDPLGDGENNTAAILMTGITSCNNIGAYSFIQINEVTTVATVWALAPFMNATAIGAPTTNQTGLASAFIDVATLANVVTGVSPGANLPAGTTVPNAEINTLADALASCVNSTGPSSTGCTNLFAAATPSGGSAPSDTVATALDIARNPGNNVGSIITASGPALSQPFQPTIVSANDLTIAILFSGSGITAPSAVAADASGNIWVTNSTANTVTELAHNGTPQSGSPYTAGSLNAPSAIAIDTSGNAWIANSGNSTLTELTSAGANATNSPFSGGGLSTPASIAFDGVGNVWLANFGNNSVSEFSSSGAALSPNTTGYSATGVSAPVGLAINPH